ncbi:hypothetical protein N7494_009199 [Penicillium frequentans]|uniref:Uncharacterized protein n=1 Tax=Penicillium frequentans TaxID=3151616 RepID=A0AAD6CPC5_9EURO|nr:hypothetical protein N7494_009199 [Penicillium glabrum]
MIMILLDLFMEPDDFVKHLQVGWTRSFLEEWIGDKGSGVNNVFTFDAESRGQHTVLYGPE